jgi:large subunit ribosomal protein L15
MNLHTLRNSKGAKKRRMRVGRGTGSGKGKTSGRGHKGQMARSGAWHKPTFEGGQMPLVRRIPKRGFTNVNRKDFRAVNLRDLDAFADGAEVTVEALRSTGLLKGPAYGVKILGTGDCSRKLTVHAHAFSASARQKIEAAGGACVVVA